VSYTVLARKYRSRTFEDVIGQEAIATTLVNAIKTGRIHHGYLFTGTRGVGKTSMARILAKALNCHRFDAPTTTPCGECDSCRAIAEGQDIDVIEIDAASNTGVDNIRELRSNTAYRPARSRYKIYIIDEVHMLSTGAFNALLKTLEEPPEHVKFILATTEIQKVPATIQSRCQRFNFRHIGPEVIAERLAAIVKSEGARSDAAALRRIARLANGSMRDALSILDQLLSVAPDKVSAAVLDEILPPPQDEHVFRLLNLAADGDAAGVLAEADKLLAGGRGLEVFCNDAIEVLRGLLLIRACGADSPVVDVPAAARDDYVKLAGRFELSHYVQMIAMLEELKRAVRYSGVGRALTDALLVRFARLREWSSIEQLLLQVPAAADEKKKNLTPPAAPPRGPAVEQPPRAAETTATAAPPAAASTSRFTPDPPAAPPVAAHSEPAPQRAGAGPARAAAPAVAPRIAAPSAASDSPTRRIVAPDERARAQADPVVQQALQLFDGIVVNVVRTPASGLAADAAVTPAAESAPGAAELDMPELADPAEMLE
jgi:DNA polymerase-3 subunit gamma/tau